MTKKVLKHSLLLLLVLIIWSCGSGDKIQDESNEDILSETDTETSASLMDTYTELNTNMNIYWDSLLYSEKEKIATMNRLLQEVSYNPRHSASRLKDAQQKVDALKELKIAKDQLNEDQIDAYDAKMDEVVNLIIDLVEQTPNMANYPLSKDLAEDMQVANTDGLIKYRSKYSDAVKYYNKFVASNRKKLVKQGIKTDKVKSFYLVEE